MDILEQTDYRHFVREACYHYFTNFPQRKESGCYSEVNILGLSEVTIKSVSMKLRRKSVQRARQQQQEHAKVSKNISVVLSDTDSSHSDSVEEIKDHASVIHDIKCPINKRRSSAPCQLSKEDSMKLRCEAIQRGRQEQREHKVSENISVVLSDTDSSQSDSVEEFKDLASVIHDMKFPIKKHRYSAPCQLSKEDSMKLRCRSVQRGRQQQREHKVSEDISVVLSDTDSSQSDSVEEIKDHVSVIHDMKCPIKKSRVSCRLSKEDERPLSIVEPQYGTIQKIFLAPDAMAEDTLGKLRMMANTSDSELRPRSPAESPGESVLDKSNADLTVESGPSSPIHPVVTIRCKECVSLFAKMRKRPTPKMKSRDRNPESLSCDEWILLKKWQPQRQRHREKGLLWASLTRIRKLSAQCSDSAAINRAQVNCSRPHVFQQRSLRRCKYPTSVQTDRSIIKAKSRHRKRPRALVWPPIGGWNSSMKRKSSINDSLSQQLYPLNLSVRVTQEDALLVDEQISGLNADLRQNSDACSKQRRTHVQGKLNEQEVSDGTDGTRRVLRFDDTPVTVAVETEEQRKSPRQRHEHEEICEAQKGFQNDLQKKLSEDSDGFRTPTDLFSVKPKIKLGKQKKVSASGDTKSTVQKPNFMSMLATLVKNQNQIIKESCK